VRPKKMVKIKMVKIKMVNRKNNKMGNNKMENNKMERKKKEKKIKNNKAKMKVKMEKLNQCHQNHYKQELIDLLRVLLIHHSYIQEEVYLRNIKLLSVLC